MRRDDASYPLDMLVAARDAVAFSEGLSFSRFVGEQRSQLAIVKAVEIVGEAAARLSRETTEAHPDIPWREVVGMRNRLVHGVFDIDLQVVWDSVQKDLPVLIAHLEPLVSPEGQ